MVLQTLLITRRRIKEEGEVVVPRPNIRLNIDIVSSTRYEF